MREKKKIVLLILILIISSVSSSCSKNIKDAANNQSIYELKKSIEEKYGIYIYYEKDELLEFDNYDISVCTDSKKIEHALTELEELFVQLPQGFLEDFSLKYSSHEILGGIDIFLCEDAVTTKQEINFDVGGFYTIENGKHAIVLDIVNANDIRKAVAHEICHAMDYKILHMDPRLKKDSYYEWEQLNPYNFKYHESFYSAEGEKYSQKNDEAYTMGDPRSKEDVNNVFFASAYSTVNEDEDRAEIFGILMGTREDEELPEYFESEKLKAKARYMFEVIRGNFETVKGDDVYWERWFE